MKYVEGRNDIVKDDIQIEGCMDPNAINYNPRATIQGTCIYKEDPWK